MQWLETLKKISASYALNDKQIETLGTETTLVLLGIIHLEEYKKILADELKLPQVSLDKMLQEIDSLVLSSVRPHLEKAFEANSVEEVEQKDFGKELDERFKKLPENIQKAIARSNYYATLYSIGEENKLNVVQMGILEEATTKLILDNIPPSEFERAVKAKLNLPDEQIKKIVNSVNDRILKVIREFLKNSRSVGVGKEEDKILKSAGIEIIPAGGEPNLNALELNAPAKTTPPSQASPMLAKKFSGSFQIPSTKTEYTVPNVSRPGQAGVEVAPKKPTVDPYREIPE